jgi:hypothetical protein
MKAVLRILTVVFLILAIMFFVQAGLVQYMYSVRIEQQLKLADDASMPQAKLEYLVKYKEAVIKNIDRNEARYIFKTRTLDKKGTINNSRFANPKVDRRIGYVAGFLVVSARYAANIWPRI